MEESPTSASQTSSASLHLLPVQKDNEDIRKTVLLNIIKMITYRGWILPEHVDARIAAVQEEPDDGIYEIALDVDLVDTIYKPKKAKLDDGTHIIVKLIKQKVTGLNKPSQIMEFVRRTIDHKILIVDSINDKSRNTIMKEHCEVFTEAFFMINLVEHYASPQYIFLSPDQQSAVLRDYEVKKIDLRRMYLSDPAARYLHLEKGEIVKIINNAYASGKQVSYAIIIS